MFEECLEVTPGFEPGNQGFADPRLTAWPCHRILPYIQLYSSVQKNMHLEMQRPL